MPCFVFTYHAHGSWLPNHPRGYVKRGKGYLPRDVQLAEKYREQMNGPTVVFTPIEQEVAIGTLVQAVGFINCELHYVPTDRTHIHAIVSWSDETAWQKRRNSLKKAITINLKEQQERKTWLSEGSSRKQVSNQEHFDYLITVYLPKHCGLKWSAQRGIHS